MAKRERRHHGLGTGLSSALDSFLGLLMSGGCLQEAAVSCALLIKELASGQSMTYNCQHK